MSIGKVLFDLDGTLAIYKGWKGERHIGEPIPAMIQIVKEKLAAGYVCEVFTARMSDPDPKCRQEVAQAVSQWTLKHIGVALNTTCTKDFSVVEIYDDRAKQVIFNTGVLVEDRVLEDRASQLWSGRTPERQIFAVDIGDVHDVKAVVDDIMRKHKRRTSDGPIS